MFCSSNSYILLTILIAALLFAAIIYVVIGKKKARSIAATAQKERDTLLSKYTSQLKEEIEEREQQLNEVREMRKSINNN